MLQEADLKPEPPVLSRKSESMFKLSWGGLSDWKQSWNDLPPNTRSGEEELDDSEGHKDECPAVKVVFENNSVSFVQVLFSNYKYFLSSKVNLKQTESL